VRDGIGLRFILMVVNSGCGEVHGGRPRPTGAVVSRKKKQKTMADNEGRLIINWCFFKI
jgi:hypothetical protein